MPLSDHVTLTITTDSVGSQRAGFGVPLILSHLDTGWAERTRTYTSLTGVAADFAVTTSPEYLAAQALFAQNPSPSSIKIGRGALQPTQVYTMDIATVRNSHAYTIGVKGEGVTAETVSFTSDATATDGEIVAGLVAALNLVTGKNFTAAGATSPFTVTGDAAADWFSLEVDPADILAKQTHSDPGVATDLAAIVNEDDDWYALVTLYNSNAYVKAAAAWIETKRKLYIPALSEGRACTVAVTGATDTLDDINTLGYARTACVYHHDPSEFCDAAWLGKCLPSDPGSITWKWKTLSGISASSLTGTYRTNLVAKSGNFNQTVAGVNIMAEGTVADTTYLFIDTMRFLDWLYDDMSGGVFDALAGADKIPFTDPGIAVVEAEVRASLQRGIARGGLAEDPAPVVTVPAAADVSAANKTARTLPDVKWSATLAGAVHDVEITGVVSV